MNTINWNQEIFIDESVEKYDLHEYSPRTGTDLNARFTDIRIEIKNQDQFLLPSESYLYIEAVLSYDEPYKYEEDIGLINNAIICTHLTESAMNYLKGKLRVIHILE